MRPVGRSHVRTSRRPAVAWTRECALALILVAFFVAQGAGVWAQEDVVGVRPSNLVFEDPPVLRETSKEGELRYSLTADGPRRVTIEVGKSSNSSHEAWQDASAWVKAEPSGTFMMEPTNNFPVAIVVTPPAEAANGRYHASVRMTLHGEEQSSGEGVQAGIDTVVTATVAIQVGGEQVKQVRADGAPQVADAEEEGQWRFVVPLENTGNVEANPNVRVDVYDKNRERVLKSFWFNETSLRPGERGEYAFTLQDIGLPKDQYWAVITILLDGEQVSSSAFETFDVVEFGALKRLLELRTIRVGDGTSAFAEVDDLVQVAAIVSNTIGGELDVTAQFKGTVMRDGQLVDALESDALLVPVGEQVELQMLYRFEEPGAYEFIGKAHYGADPSALTKLTEEKTTLMTVSGSAGFGGLMPLLVIAGVVALLGVGAFVVRKVMRSGGAAPARRPHPASRRGGKHARRPEQGRPGAPGRAQQGAARGRRPGGPQQGRPQGGHPQRGGPARRAPGDPRPPPTRPGAPPSGPQKRPPQRPR